MTKDEYLKQAWEKQCQESLVSPSDALYPLFSILFENGFNAACEYYRNHVLELNDYEQGNAESL